MRVAVVGAGITGLSAARELALTGHQVVVLDAAARPGGKVAAGELGFDVGAESMLARRPEALELIASLGLTGQVVHPTDATSGLWCGGTVHPLPPSVQGVPVSADSLTDLLSPTGVARVRAEPSLPAPALDADVAIGDYLSQRCGEEVVDRLLEPMLGGVYAGHSRALSFAAVHPSLWARVRTGGSLLMHARTLRPEPAAGPRRPVFAGLRGGVHTLVAALAADLASRGVEIRTGCTARELTATATGYRLVAGPVPAPQELTVDAVLLAVPATPAGRLLAGLTPAAAGILTGIPYASTALVTLVVRQVTLTGSGLLVPPGELPTVKALTHSSIKWDWVRAVAEERFGPGSHVVRVSIGRAGEEALLQVGDQALVERTVDELTRRLPGWAGMQLVTSAVQRWGGGLPQYAVGHLERIRAVNDELAGLPGIAVCGAYLAGLGIPACIHSGHDAVHKISR